MKGNGKPSGLLAVIGDLRAPKGSKGAMREDDQEEESDDAGPAYDEEAAAQRAVDAAKKGDARGFLAAFRELHSMCCDCGGDDDEGEE